MKCWSAVAIRFLLRIAVGNWCWRCSRGALCCCQFVAPLNKQPINAICNAFLPQRQCQFEELDSIQRLADALRQFVAPKCKLERMPCHAMPSMPCHIDAVEVEAGEDRTWPWGKPFLGSRQIIAHAAMPRLSCPIAFTRHRRPRVDCVRPVLSPGHKRN